MPAQVNYKTVPEKANPQTYRILHRPSEAPNRRFALQQKGDQGWETIVSRPSVEVLRIAAQIYAHVDANDLKVTVME